MIFEDLVIVGSRVPDGVQREFDPPGTVQAFDARTGQRRWVFFTIPQSRDDFGADTWEDESWRYTSHAKVWGLMALDAGRGLLYVPTSTPSGDYWGGRRKGANLFAESLVCLDARTGERRWHFRGVHHGLWDYDLAAAPNLATITVEGREIDAVAQVSKQGFIYVFDRVTGEPVWPIVERPVDTDTYVPGEEVYPTQPFPLKPRPWLGFAQFKRRKRGNRPFGCKERRGVPAYRCRLRTVKNPPMPATGAVVPGRWHPRRSATACRTRPRCVG